MWKVKKTERILDSEYVKVDKDDVILPHGREIADFYKVTIKDCAAVVALTDDGKVVLKKEYRHYGILRCPACGRSMVKVGINSTKKAKAWVCQGEGKGKTIGERSKCPTYLLWADVLDRSVKSALEIDGSITYGKLDELVKKITIGKDAKSLIITHRDGKRKKYPLIFESYLDALEAMNVGFPYESREALEATYEYLKRSARKNIVIEKEEGEIPEVIDPVRTIQKEKKNAGNKTRKRRKKA